MTYGRFLDLLEEMILERCSSCETVKRVQVLKLNNLKLDGFSCRIPDHREQPTVYVNQYYREDLLTDEISEIADLVLEILRTSFFPKEIPVEEILDYEQMRPHIYPRLISKEKNQELLMQVPYIPWMDLEVVFYIRVPEHMIKNATILVNHQHLKIWSIDPEELYGAAFENLAKEPACLHPLDSFFEAYDLPKMESGMYLLSNVNKEYGAAMILNPLVQKMCADRFGEDYYILPSSVHELLLLPVSYGSERYELDLIVQEANRNCLRTEEFLSHHAYYYSIKNHCIKM